MAKQRSSKTQRETSAKTAKGAVRGSARVASRSGAAQSGAARKNSSGSIPDEAARAKSPRLLSGGNPQISKALGDAPVQAYIDAMPGWKREVGQQLDGIIVRAASPSADLRKAVKWNSPFYGVEGKDGFQGWFLAFHCFTKYVKVTFFRGTSLRPMPPGESKTQETRYLDIREGDAIDESQFAAWVRQASKLPGWDGK